MNPTEEQLLYRLALSMIPGIGGITAKKLIDHCGSAKSVFREKKNILQKIPGIGEKTSRKLGEAHMLERAEKELRHMQRLQIRALYYRDADYPYRLKQCEDGPLLLFVRGKAKLNHRHVLSIVGTRNMTAYGREACEKLLAGLLPFQPLVISGMAYGIDATAHRAALKNNLITGAVLGHGLDRIYPSLHMPLAREIENKGVLLSDFPTGTRPDRENFPKRNRIIAGLCDALIVIEAAISGGALITANMANAYNRDVFALPGRTNDLYSQGCHLLIKSHKAHLFESAADIQYIMNWEAATKNQPSPETALTERLSPAELKIHALLKEKGESSLDHIVTATGIRLGLASHLLLGLECKGLISTLPGKIFRLKA